MRTTTLASILLGATATLVASCSSSSSSNDITAPSIASATQNRTVDPTGFTIDLRMSENIDPVAANLPANWSASAGNILTSTLQADNRTVRLVMDALSVPGAVTFGAAAGVASTGNIDLTAQVTDGDTVTISDGTYSRTFEFTSGGGATAGNLEVDKGASATTAIAAFIVAFNAATPYDIAAVAGAGDSADLTAGTVGDHGNVLITEVDAGGVITLVGLAGGGGIKDASGNTIAAPIAGIALIPDSLVPPTAAGSGATVEGADNDTLTFVFNDDMIEADVETAGNWAFEAPIGTAFDVTGATFDYVPANRTATVTFVNAAPGIAGADGNNMQTFDMARANLSGMRNFSGNLLSAANMDFMIAGDETPPTFDSVWADGVAEAVTVRFSEPVKAVAFADLYSGGIDDGARFQLTDQDNTLAAAATGTLTFTGDPVDAETFTLDDGAGNSDIFEFESAGGVTGGNIAIAIATGDNNQMAINAQAAIAGSTVAITAANVGPAVNLTNNVSSAAGNVAIAGTVTNFTIAGMTGGATLAAGLATLEAANYLFTADGTGVLVDYDIVPAVGADTIDLYGIVDLAGNHAFASQTVAIAAEDANASAIDAGNSSLASVAGETNDQIVVRFDRNMSPFNITNPANYTAAPLDLSNSRFTFNGTNEVTIDLDSAAASDVQFGTNYTLTLVMNAGTPFYTAQGIALGGNDTQVIAGSGDNAAIAAATAYVGSVANTCICVFPEAPGIAAATLLANYDIGAANPTAITQLTPRAFQLTFAVQPAAANTLNIQIAAATDLGGTPAAGILNIALTAAEVVLPTATFTANSAAGIAQDFFFVDFSEGVDQTTALAAANYAFISGGTSVSLTGATFEYDSTNFRVEITLPSSFSFNFGDTVSCIISNVTDLSGNVITAAPANVTVIGDNTNPGFFGADSAFLNLIRDAAGTTVDVQFDEAIDEAFVETIGNWTTSGATVVTAATLVSSNIVRLTTDVQIGAAETLSLNNLPDLAGNNTGGIINVNPQE